MKLSQLAAKPQLIKIVIDDADIVEEFGEAVEFWTWDRHPMDTFLKMAANETQDMSTMITAVQALVLDEEGNTVLSNEQILPTKIMMRVIQKVVEGLGKL
jgi:hypothetical protein